MFGKVLMDSYTPIFEKSQKLAEAVDYFETFEYFHDYPELYHFIIAPEGQLTRDERALNQAKEIDPEIYQALYDKGPSLLGNGSSEIDGIESRHILIMTYLISKLGKNWGDVIEIGGGYGNYPRLADGIVSTDTWSIIDLNYISDLQCWFLKNNNIRNVYCYSFEAMQRDLQDYESDPVPYNLLLGIHSLSEFNMETFNSYLPIINRAKWFCYVCQDKNPSLEILVTKLSIIMQEFNIVDVLEYEGGTSLLYLFKNIRT